ncbi:DNA repair protein RadA [Pseudodesulfovibrio profundus]|uniref:DNA repair protein RadA n=1 Tax=Pseudodesulfovibrio profundus TaxID=57320 RepID=A0A2C8FB40_9BACT|nr:DNA repair protein RadA [Pseudodesulfovibrio profundus]MBC16008.1 DNA repair protein RadA [Desulfovibrio sp.]SOB59368.1 DNA repair protein RadA [Pseudodesulfovibrio profundus]|tara:strand:- start:19075 stop:20400 length:1326 start_codon:yes stop_codon:yes gene_type:complete
MKTKEAYRCAECGAQSPRWQGQCTACKQWNTLEPVTVTKKASTPVGAAASQDKPRPLEELATEELHARTSGIPSLDELLGSGLVPGAAILLGGEPGIGKSTLLLQLAGSQAKLGHTGVYLSGEESLPQLKGRAERLELLGPGLLAISTNKVEDALAILDGPNPPELLIVDSVQTLASPLAEGIPGSISQVRAVSAELVEKTKKTGTTLILVGHVTKDGQIAGPKLLEHMVDTVLYLEGDRKHFSRILRVLKNRFGPSDELVVFTMKEKGLEVVEDPATFFLGSRDPSLSGTAMAMAVDGQRPFAVEVQALVSKSFLSIPRRTALGFDTNRLNLLLAVLEKRLRLNLSGHDIYAKITGGLATKDPGLDLAVIAAILSSFYDQPLPESSVYWGEIDLNGQVRPVAAHDVRLKQAKRLGHNPVCHSGTSPTLADLQRVLFGKSQ